VTKRCLFEQSRERKQTNLRNVPEKRNQTQRKAQKKKSRINGKSEEKNEQTRIKWYIISHG
jgi:hypothetical protein